MRTITIILTMFFLLACSGNTKTQKIIDNVSIKSVVDTLQQNKSFSKIETGNWVELSYEIVREDDDEIYVMCEEIIPVFPGGYDALAHYLKSVLKYPQTAINDSITGRVLTSFIVDKEGRITDVLTMKGVRSDLDSVCIKAIIGMPNWERPKSDRKPVSVRFSLPVLFKFRD